MEKRGAYLIVKFEFHAIGDCSPRKLVTKARETSASRNYSFHEKVCIRFIFFFWFLPLHDSSNLTVLHWEMFRLNFSLLMDFVIAIIGIGDLVHNMFGLMDVILRPMCKGGNESHST